MTEDRRQMAENRRQRDWKLEVEKKEGGKMGKERRWEDGKVRR